VEEYKVQDKSSRKMALFKIVIRWFLKLSIQIYGKEYRTEQGKRGERLKNVKKQAWKGVIGMDMLMR
jgi:hypothetical protein